jgi:Domain of unknown function (DUF1738).
MNIIEKILQDFAKVIINKMETITSDWKTPWIAAKNRTPKNIKGNPYNGVNFFMLSIVCDLMDYKIPVFMTFNQAK